MGESCWSLSGQLVSCYKFSPTPFGPNYNGNGESHWTSWNSFPPSGFPSFSLWFHVLIRVKTTTKSHSESRPGHLTTNEDTVDTEDMSFPMFLWISMRGWCQHQWHLVERMITSALLMVLRNTVLLKSASSQKPLYEFNVFVLGPCKKLNYILSAKTSRNTNNIVQVFF